MIHLGIPGEDCKVCGTKLDNMTRGRECYLDLDPVIVRNAQSVVSGEASTDDRFMVRAMQGERYVAWTGVAGVTQTRELMGDPPIYEITTLVQDYAKILARG